MTNTTLRSLGFAAALTLTATLQGQEAPAATAAAPETDRQAILAMAGQFEVDFRFEETLGFQPGYELTKPYHEDARELVIVAEDSPRRISLQHLLVVGGGHVIQHWRQVWTYEDTRVNEFQGLNRWKTTVLSADQAKGTWSQLVTNVDNSPRYEGWGKWEHVKGVSSWTSNTSHRPLPRREYTKRKDYDLLVAINRHTITPEGWAHEQDNTKLDLNPEGDKYISREYGLNTYKKSEKDFSAATNWWASNAEFSNALYAAWEDIMKRDSYAIADEVDTDKLRRELKSLEDAKPTAEERAGKIREAIAKYVIDYAEVKVAENK